MRRCAKPLCTLNRTTAVAPISTAVTQTSRRLSEMAVANRDRPAFLEHRQEQFRALGQLLDVEIAAVFARRQGA